MIDKPPCSDRHVGYFSNYPGPNSELNNMEPEELPDLFVPTCASLTQPSTAPGCRATTTAATAPSPSSAATTASASRSAHLCAQPLPSQHHPDLPRRPRHQLLHQHGPPSRPDGHGRRTQLMPPVKTEATLPRNNVTCRNPDYQCYLQSDPNF